MKTSISGQTLIKAFESCLKRLPDGRYTTYYCPAHVLTIGWGSTRDDAPDMREGDVWSRQKCDDVFAASLGKYEAAVDALSAKRVAAKKPALTQNQYDALVSLVYNCGPGAVKASGGVGSAVIEGRDSDVPGEIAHWNKAAGRVLAGLVRRRKAEGELWRGDFASASKTADTIIAGSMPQAVSNVQTPIATVQEKPKSAAAVAGGVVTTAVVAAAPAASHHPVLWLVGAIAVVAVGFGIFEIVKHHLSAPKE